MATINFNIRADEQSNPLVENGIAGENMIRGSLVYLSSNGKFLKTDASDSNTTNGELRIVLNDLATNDKGVFLHQGIFYTLDVNFIPGTKYYVSDVPGEITTTRYTNTNIVRYIGTAQSSARLEFNPSNSTEDLGIEINTFPILFSNLPTTTFQGMERTIVDASGVAYRGIASGGGSDFCKVIYDGTNWIYH